MHPIDTQLRLANQTGINARMRSILIEWLWEVCKSFKLHAATFFRSVNYVDRYLVSAPETIERSRLQLVGIGALFVASKVEEIYAPEGRDFVYICDKAYTKQQLVDFERILVSTLDWRLQVPVFETTNSTDEYAAVIMAIDGGVGLTPVNRKMRSRVRGIGKRLRDSTACANRVTTRSRVLAHDPLVILSKTTVRLDEIEKFYKANRRLTFDA